MKIAKNTKLSKSDTERQWPDRCRKPVCMSNKTICPGRIRQFNTIKFKTNVNNVN